MRILHRALIAAALITAVAAAQSPDRFDVASIKRADPASADGIVDVFPGRLWVPNGSVRSMIVAAPDTYTWFMVVDDDSNGAPNGVFYDLTQVTIR
jgi:hypothetical protein